MVITKPKLGIILAACFLLNFSGTALTHRIAFYLLCPEPGISVASFDLLRVGMPRDQILARLDPQQFVLEAAAANLHLPFRFQGHHVWRFHRDNIEIDLELENGSLTDGMATVGGRLVRQHLQPRDPLIDPLRQLIRRTEAAVARHRPFELLSYPVALVAGIGLVGVLASARQSRMEPRFCPSPRSFSR